MAFSLNILSKVKCTFKSFPYFCSRKFLAKQEAKHEAESAITALQGRMDQPSTSANMSSNTLDDLNSGRSTSSLDRDPSEPHHTKQELNSSVLNEEIDSLENSQSEEGSDNDSQSDFVLHEDPVRRREVMLQAVQRRLQQH